MDHIDKYLATTIQDESVSVGLQSALALGKRTLNRYYNLTDCSDIYRIAMGAFIYLLNYFYNSLSLVLHPHHKLKYFENAGWEEDWVDTARQIVRDEFDRTYAFMDIEVDEDKDKLEANVRVVFFFPISLLTIIILLANHSTLPEHVRQSSGTCSIYVGTSG